MYTIDKFEFEKVVYFPKEWEKRERRRYGYKR